MGRIPEYKSKAPVTAEVGGVMADQAIDAVRYERGMAARMWEGVSKESNTLSQKLQENEALLKAAQAESSAAEQIDNAHYQLIADTKPQVDKDGNVVGDPDWDTAKKNYASKLSEIKKNTSVKLKGKVKEYFDRAWIDIELKSNKHAREFLWENQIRYQKAKGDTEISNRIKRGDYKGAVSVVNGLEAGGVYKPDEAEKIRREAKEKVKEKELRDRFDSMPAEQALEILGSSNAQEYGCEEKTLNSIKSDLNTKWKIEKYHRKEYEKQQEQEIDDAISNFYAKFSQNPNAQDALAMKNWLNKVPGIKNRDAKMKTFLEFIDNPDTFKKDDPIIYNNMRDRAKAHDPTLTFAEIDNAMGHGLSVKGVTEIKDIMRKEDYTFEDKLKDNAEAYLKKAIFPTGMILDDEEALKRSQALLYAQAMLEEKIQEAKQNNKSISTILSPKISANGEQVNPDFIIDDIVKMFAPGGSVNIKTYGEEQKEELETGEAPEPPKGFKRIK